MAKRYRRSAPSRADARPDASTPDALPPHSPVSWAAPERCLPGGALFWLAVCLATLIAAWLRLHRIGDRGLWIDEITSLRDASEPLSLSKPHFLSFYILKASLRFGDSPFFLRLPSAVFGAAGVAAFAWMLKRWFGPAVALLGAVWIAVNPYHLYFSLEARYYAELIFFASLALAAWPSLSGAPRPWAIGLFLAANIACYGIHPTAAVFFAMQAVALAALWGWSAWAWSRSRPVAEPRVRLEKPVFAAAAAIAIAAALWIGPFLWNHIRQSNLAAWLANEDVELARNVGWNARFLFFPFRFAMIYGANPHPWVPWITAAACLAGLVRSWRSARLFFALAIGGWLSVLAAAWLYNARQPFSSKYAAFLFPLYLGLAAYGAEWTTSGWNRFGARARQAACAALAALLAALHAPSAAYCLRGEFAGYLRALEQAAQSAAGAPEPLYTSTQGAFICGYYRRNGAYPEIQPIDIRQIGAEISPGVASVEIKQALARGKRPWFAFPQAWDKPLWAEAAEAMLRFAEPVATIPCMTGAPSYSIDVAQAPPPERIADGAAGLCRWQIERLPFESDVYALAPGDFILAASGPDASRLNAAIEGAEPQRLERSGEDAAWAARLAAGKSRLRIDGPALSAPCGIVLRRAESAALHPRLFQFVSMTPPNDGWLYEETREGEILTMTRNSGVGYELDIPEDGGWRLEVEARSDAPFAIAEAALDGRRLGALAWLEADGEPAIRTLDFTASRGTRRLEIHFLSDAYPPPDEEDLDSDLSLTGVRIAPAADGEARSGGGDILRAVPLVRLPRAFYDDFFQARPGREEGYWEILGDCQASEKPGAGQPEMRLEIPPDSAGANVQSTLFAAEAGRWIYGGFEMRAEDLRNHTANIAALFFDGDRAMLQIQIGYATGLNETQSDWARMPYLFQAPTGAAHCGLRIAIYPNSNRPSSQPGYVEIRHPWGAEAVE